MSSGTHGIRAIFALFQLKRFYIIYGRSNHQW